jgi:signal transduction histidine kinase
VGRRKVSVELKEAFLQGFIDDLLSDLENILKPGQHFKKEIKEILLETDWNLFKNALINLISNASKYSAKDKCIRISNEVKDGFFSLYIKDEGIGIPAKEQKRIFERFYRTSNVSNIEGTGIGLNLVKSYMEKLGGSVSFESEEGKGSTFCIVLPLKK